MRRPGISRTAVKLATGVIVLGDDPGMPSGAGELAARLLRAAGALPRTRERRIRSRGFRRLVVAASRAMEGGRGHLVRRKAWFDARARGGPEDALIVLGGGFDSLAIRVAGDRPATACFEVDLPATSAGKAAAAAGAGLSLPNLRFVPLDLGEGGLAASLLREGFRPGTPAVTVAEGLLMYLREAEVEGLLADLAAVTGPATRLAFSWMRTGARGAGLAALLSSRGWRLEETTGGLESFATAVRT